MRKIIGIGGNLKFDVGGKFPGYARSYVNDDYVQAVISAGGVPIILPVLEDREIVRRQLEIVDAVILSGGYDVNPQLFGEEPHKLLGDTLKERDTFDTLLIQEARKLGLPILGICRGLQILNVIAGGTLYQDCSEADNSFVCHWQSYRPDKAAHSVSIVDDSILYNIFGENTQVNSFHHMAIHKLAEGYRATAHAADGIIEGIEATEGSWVLAVQWHPEMMHRVSENTLNLFRLLIKKAG